LLTGSVKATSNFGKLPAGRKLALVLMSINKPSMSLLEITPSNVDGVYGKNVRYFNYAPPLNQYIAYAGPLEAKENGYPFSAPYAAHEGFLTPMAVECDAKESYSDCALRAFPIPANAHTVPGRVYRLIGKKFLLPSCGMKNVELYLHKFPAPGSEPPTTTSAPPSLPPEILPNLSFY